MRVPPTAPLAALAFLLATGCSTSSPKERHELDAAAGVTSSVADEGASATAEALGWREIPTRAGEAGPTLRRHVVDVVSAFARSEPALAVSPSLPAQIDPGFGGPPTTAARVDAGERRVWIVGDAVCTGLATDGDAERHARLTLAFVLTDIERGETHASHRASYDGRGETPEQACDRALEAATRALEAEWPGKIKDALEAPPDEIEGAFEDEGVRDPTEAPLTAGGAVP